MSSNQKTRSTNAAAPASVKTSSLTLEHVKLILDDRFNELRNSLSTNVPDRRVMSNKNWETLIKQRVSTTRWFIDYDFNKANNEQEDSETTGESDGDSVDESDNGVPLPKEGLTAQVDGGTSERKELKSMNGTEMSRQYFKPILDSLTETLQRFQVCMDDLRVQNEHMRFQIANMKEERGLSVDEDGEEEKKGE